ncbi:hypothetical protein [Streptomyces cellostaticus]|uniref:hypothetical protein n=1 Tax=Streptomyces cellostaticus TaxID=67285 RepID=UPI002025C014|nr:hypothetical protein [Streptomyces cellostaticus]
MLIVPDISGLAADRRRGAVCVWCAKELTAETAIPLDDRRVEIDGEPTICFPRACRGCGRQAAVRESQDHKLNCPQCLKEPNDCRERHAIRRLTLDGRR